MWNPKNALFIALGLLTLWYLAMWWRLARKARAAAAAGERPHTPYHSVVAFVACFFDTLGIGNFAPTTSAFKFRSSVPDEKIPGTLNVGYTLPTVAQAFIYISLIEVDLATLVLMIAASVAGAWLGAGIVVRWSRRKIQIGMGCALFVAAVLFLLRQLNIGPAGGETLSLEGARLALGLAGNFILGALMTLGIGLYAPCLILISLLGMNPRAAFPIMMGSCAFLMPVGSVRFIREGRYSLGTSIVMAVAGVPAVLIAAYLVREMPLDYVRWLVIFVVVYASAMMLRSAARERSANLTPAAGPESA